MVELDRRNFLKAVGISAGAAAAAGCKEPVEKVIPYLNQPEEIIPGIPTYYASTCGECPIGCGIQVKTREGRPIKVEGNPEDPSVRGTLCIRGQASLARTYDPARFRSPMVRQDGKLVPTDWDTAEKLLVEKLGAAGQGGKAFFLSGLETGTLDGLIDSFMTGIGSPRRLRYETFGQEALRAANGKLFGQPVVPRFAFEKADLVLSFGTDFLETWLNPVEAQAGFAASRREGRGYAVYIGPRLGLTGANCDSWLAPVPGTEILVALGLAREVARRRPGVDLGAFGPLLQPYTLEAVSERTEVSTDRLEQLVDRLLESKAPLALPPGAEIQGSNAANFALAVQLLNWASGAIGRTVVFGPNHKYDGLGTYEDLRKLASDLRSGGIGVLLVRGVNPVYSAPRLGFADAIASPAVFTVSFASASDETTALADLVLPDHTPFESWGDGETVAGVRRVQQPTIRPLFATRSTGEVLVRAAGELGVALPGATDLRARIGESFSDFAAALARGGEFAPTAPVEVSLVGSAPSVAFEPASLEGSGDLTLVLYPSLYFYDGRSARIASLQETPDPVTKLVWGSYAELHPTTASSLGLAEGDVVRVETSSGSVELPAFAHEGVRPGVVAVAIGQGHQPVDPDAPAPDRLLRRSSIGVNGFQLLSDQTDAVSGAQRWLAARASVKKTTQVTLLPRTQATFDQEGRGVAQAVSLATLVGPGSAASPGEHGAETSESSGDHHEDVPYADAMHLETAEFDAARDARDPNYRWGMAIDLDACTGCGACIAACSTENNVPSIGIEQARLGREMQWIRLERYVEHHGDEIEVRHTPMLCQHCGAAPCESVCPVFATYHNPEGLNVMVPNRCIGTRYCGNNCPYKVRRFNYFAYDWSLREPEQLALNPDVIVRSKGVMEKCSLCVQRINGAKDRAVAEGRLVREGEITPACAQTCPSQAITFGNYKDPDSKVSQLSQDPRAYWVFHHLNTRPGITYLKSVQRGEQDRVETARASGQPVVGRTQSEEA